MTKALRWTPEQFTEYQSRHVVRSVAAPKRSKYGAKKTQVDGITFDSQAEATRYCALKVLERMGMIEDLRLQVVFDLVPSVVIAGRKRPPIRYVADFVYVSHGAQVVEDVKGIKTPVYLLKRHMMAYLRGIEIQEISC
jgi:hypothetical protein